MFIASTRKEHRKGVVAPLMALLLIPILAMIAFAVDLGYLITVKSDLQNVADAAALAGAQKLMDPYCQWLIPATGKDTLRSQAITDAKNAAKAAALANKAGGTFITVNDSDIQVGFLDALGNFNPNPATSVFPNSVRVTTRRDSQANSQVALFFAPVIGTSSLPLQTSARATIYTAAIVDLKKSAPKMLPMTYDVQHWDTFMATGRDPDNHKSVDNSGNPAIQVYPSIKFPGNFGQLSLDDSHVGSSDIVSWINYGMSTADADALHNAGLVPLNTHAANTWDWIGNPGFQSDTVSQVNLDIGQTYLLPLFQAKDSSTGNYQAGVGQGSNYYYDIVRFVPITITDPVKVNKTIIVRPSAYIDPAAVFDLTTLTPAGTSGSTITSFTTPKLSQ